MLSAHHKFHFSQTSVHEHGREGGFIWQNTAYNLKSIFSSRSLSTNKSSWSASELRSSSFFWSFLRCPLDFLAKTISSLQAPKTRKELKKDEEYIKQFKLPGMKGTVFILKIFCMPNVTFQTVSSSLGTLMGNNCMSPDYHYKLVRKMIIFLISFDMVKYYSCICL